MGMHGGGGNVHGTWEDLYARIADGTYATAYSVGEILPLDLGTEGVVNAQIVAFNADNKADGSGKAKVSFISQYLLNTSIIWNPNRTPSTSPYDEGTGPIGGWPASEIREYVRSTILPLLPAYVSNRIVEVTKYSRSYTTTATNVANKSSTDTIWVPSAHEISTAGGNESSGVIYTSLFNSNASRIKSKVGGSAITWFTRSAGGASNITFVKTDGSLSANAPGTSRGVIIGFCID